MLDGWSSPCTISLLGLRGQAALARMMNCSASTSVEGSWAQRQRYTGPLSVAARDQIKGTATKYAYQLAAPLRRYTEAGHS